MGRSLDQVIAELPPDRLQRIDTRYRALMQDVEGLRELRRIAGSPARYRHRPEYQAAVSVQDRETGPRVSVDLAQLRRSDRR